MDDIILLALQAMQLILLIRRKRSKRWANRRWWVRPINRTREAQGDFQNLFQELKEDPAMFFKYTRMNLPTFHKLLCLVGEHLKKNSIRTPIPPEARLAITLRYLATGDQISSIAFAYRVGISTASAIIKETCAIIHQVLAPTYLCTPTVDEWKNIAQDYFEKWNMPNCIGSVDGKHVQIQAPPNTGSDYFNYKKTFSLVLMAICDARYRFTVVDVGSPGSNNDGGIFSSLLGKAIKTGTLKIPTTLQQLPNVNLKLPYFLVGDEAFQLTQNMMRPYPGRNLDEERRIFNYRLSRARRTIENAFGILASRWRVFTKPMCMLPSSVDKIVLATICLHNFLMSDIGSTYCPPTYADYENEDGEVVEGEWRSIPNAFRGIDDNGPHRATANAYSQRDALMHYFSTPQGSVPWQLNYIRRGRRYNV